MRKLLWRAKLAWRKRFAHDGVIRDFRDLQPQPVPGVRFWYTGEPGDPDSDVPVAYQRIPHA